MGHIVHSAYLFLWRVESEVQVRIRYFVLAQVVKHWHPSSVWQRRRAHADGGAGSDFPNKLWQACPRGESTKRWYRPFQNLLRIGVRPCRVVADVAGRFYDLLTNIRGRLFNRYLFPFGPGDASQLSQVSKQRPDLRFT